MDYTKTIEQADELSLSTGRLSVGDLPHRLAAGWYLTTLASLGPDPSGRLQIGSLPLLTQYRLEAYPY